MTTTDITATGAPATLLVCNNEKGFSSKNIDSVCSVGCSTKKGHRQRGYIGEKGIGFKSVFLITANPYIFSNGYQIKFSEDPCPQCNVGYIVPQWVEEHPTVAEIQQIYGSGRTLPTTIIVLPLKSDKVHLVKQQLSAIHPEVLLFLSKIKRLSVRESNKNPKLNTLCEVSISSETEFVSRKNVNAESYTLHLSAEENSTSSEEECSYYMWRQRFPVKQENKVERRMQVEEWVITLALPIGQRLNRGMSSPGIYAFLPTEMVTNFPFIIQADFVLASSRETILLDNKWNQGILDCVPSTFISAFLSLIKSSVAAPVSTLANMFAFLPINPSSYPKLNTVRDSIKLKLMEENILPSESNNAQRFFYKPGEVGRILPAFWNILIKAQKQGVSLHNLSTHGKYVLSSAFDKDVYDNVLNFLEVKVMEIEWYAKCIRGSNLVLGVSEDLYIEILLFLFDYWGTNFQNTTIKNIPLLKYIGEDGIVSLLSIEATSNQSKKICLATDSRNISWLIDWNNEFRCSSKHYFIPKSTQEALQSFPKRETVRNWLISLGASVFSVFEYVDLLFSSIHSYGSKLVITSAHFLYHSMLGNYLSESEVNKLCKKLPLVDKYGCVTTQRSGVLVPARDSNWVALMGTNPWRGNHYVELTEDYSRSGNFAASHTKEKQLMVFLKKHIGASDIPHLCPPDDPLPTVKSPLTKANTFLLLEWIRNLKSERKLVQGKFLTSIRQGCWLRTCLGDSMSCTYAAPSQSFLLTTSDGSLLQNGSELVDIPMVDIRFYGSKINEYKEELKAIGVMFEFGEASIYMGTRLMSLAESTNLTKSNVFSILKFIRLSRQKYLPLDDFINTIKNGSWLKTRHGDLSPVGSILFTSEWKVASQISNLPLIDNAYYGDDISGFKAELKLLGVKIEFQKNYQIVVDSFKMPASLTVEATYMILECVRHTNSSTFLKVLKDRKWLNTGVLKSPSECFLFNGEWGCLLKVFSGFPSISEKHYGPDIVSYKNELKKLGVVVDFDEAAKVFADQFKQHASSSSITKENVLCLLSSCRQLKKTSHRLTMEANKSLREEKWLQTRLGPRAPRDSILFHSDWENLTPIVLLPLIDDSNTGYGREILEYKDELKAFGVVTEFSLGMRFVVSGLNIPPNPSVITSTSVLSLMNCIQILLKENNVLPEEFFKHVNRRWLKTHMGYRDPGSCLVFDSAWSSLLQPEDGPFINDAFFCSKIASYSKELKAIGVPVDVKHGCSLIACHLESHVQFTVISRIYKCLCHFNWEPKKGVTKEPGNEASGQIIIPNGSDTGRWVHPEECVIYDKDDLFGLQLNVLEKHYEKGLLDYFSSAFGVRRNPNADDYCKLWNKWESTRPKITLVECRAFWLYISKNWTLKTEKLFSEKLLKLPVSSKDSDDILLFDKDAILIPDDLQLQDYLEKASPDPLFVWYPKPSFPSVNRSKLNEIFANIGVRTISESVNKEVSSILDTAELKQITAKGTFMKRGLIRIILAYFADPSLEIVFEKRHQMASYVLDLMVFETDEPIIASYCIKLSTGSTLKVEVCIYMGTRLMSLAESTNLTKSNVFSILKFIRLSRQKYLPLDDFINTIKNGSWLKTRHGDLSPVGSILFTSEWKVASQISNLPLIDNAYYGDDISGFKAELKLLGVKIEFQKNYQIVVDSFKMPASLTVEATYMILECVRHTNSSTFLKVLKDRKWLNTGVLKSPSECFLFNGEWGCLLKVFSGFPSISEKHYGPDIVSYKNELKKLGVVVDFDEAAKVFADQFKQHASSSSITKENVLCLLSSCRQLKKTSHRLTMEANKSLREEKWLQTRLGPRAPRDSILFHSDWENLTPIVLLPLIDDRNTGYGREILEYKDELKAFGVVTEFSLGMRFVVSGLNIPPNPSVITSTSVLSLMNCIQILLKENNVLPEEFFKRVNRRWLKTHMGYRDPGSCLVFDSAWSSLLQPEDGPFINDAFFCSKIASYSKELKAIGVPVDVKHGCSLIACHLESHVQFTVISRIYKCLCHFNWEPKKGVTKEPGNEASGQIIIPNGSDTGRWVHPEECVIYDKDDLFGLQLNVLEKHYEKGLLDYFSSAFGVRRNPNADDYCKLWNKWESTRPKITLVECRAFWLYISKNWTLKTEKLFSEKLLKLPVSSKDSDDILLFDKDAILIPDDLQLQDYLEKASPDPLFVWYPKPSFPSVNRSKLNEIFANIGVRTISESANKEVSSILDTAELKQITAKGTFMKRGLIRIILAYFADPSLEIVFEKRHQMASYVLDLMVFETDEPITASYCIKLSTGSTLKVEVCQMIRWERENMKLFTQKVDKSISGHKENIAYATYFAEVIAEGLMWEKADQIAGLSELIKLAWLLDFEDEAISFLLRNKNLQLCYEDEEFIKSAFALD